MQSNLIGCISEQLESPISLLRDLVEVNSFTSNIAGVNKVQDRIEEELKALGLNVFRERNTDCGDFLVADTNCEASKRILLLGHADTVHKPDSPFKQFSLEGDIARGPGVLDMKGGIVVMLWALKGLNACGLLHSIPIRVLINSDEEIASIYSEKIIRESARDARAALVFEWGRKDDNIITRRKGTAIYELEVRGKSGHSGNNHKESASAIHQISRTICELEGLTDYSQGITINVGVVSGGSAVNIVPDLAKASFDVRVEAVETYDSFKSKLKEILSAETVPGTKIIAREIRFVPPMEETTSSRELFESFHSFSAPSGLSYGTCPAIIGGGSDANTTSAAGTPTIDGLGPYGENPHSDGEYIKVSSLIPKILNVALWLSSHIVA